MSADEADEKDSFEVEHEIGASEDGTEYYVRILCAKPLTHDKFAELLIDLGEDIRSGRLDIPVGVSSHLH